MFAVVTHATPRKPGIDMAADCMYLVWAAWREEWWQSEEWWREAGWRESDVRDGAVTHATTHKPGGRHGC